MDSVEIEPLPPHLAELNTAQQAAAYSAYSISTRERNSSTPQESASCALQTN